MQGRRYLFAALCCLTSLVFGLLLSNEIRSRASEKAWAAGSEMGLRPVRVECEGMDPDHDQHVICQVYSKSAVRLLRCPVWSNDPCSVK